jgi:hypothetical protein
MRRVPTIWIVIALLVIGGGGTVLAQRYLLPLIDETVSAQQEPEATAEPTVTVETQATVTATTGLPRRPGVPGSADASGMAVTTKVTHRDNLVYELEAGNPYDRDVLCTVTMSAVKVNNQYALDRLSGYNTPPSWTYRTTETVRIAPGRAQELSWEPLTEESRPVVADRFYHAVECEWAH